jgi:hypothetical protein
VHVYNKEKMSKQQLKLPIERKSETKLLYILQRKAQLQETLVTLVL